MDWIEYSLKLAEVASMKSKDPWNKVGCALLREDNTVASLGYNGFPSGMIENWEDRDERRKYVIHAEQNALRYVKPFECVLCSTTLLPCNDCLKALSSYGIKTVAFRRIYDYDNSSLRLAKNFGIELMEVPILSPDPKKIYDF